MRKKGQAVVEIALFGSIILLLFGTMLSYVQRQNDQQYAHMEAFRRAEEKACNYRGGDKSGAGASVQMTLITNRRHIELSSGYRKGTNASVGGGASVFWAIPEVAEDAKAASILVFKVNEDEQILDYNALTGGSEGLTVRTGEPSTKVHTEFNEQGTKQESPQDITNTPASWLKDDIKTHIPYAVVGKGSNYEPMADRDSVVAFDQGLFRSRGDGQYKYSGGAKGTEVMRSRSWTTPF